VVADEAGRITVFNRAAAKLTGIEPPEALGRDLFSVLPLYDADGRDWWAIAAPYHGLAIRTGHPECSLYLPDGTEVLVTVGYVRDRRRRGAAGAAGSVPAPQVRRLVVSLRSAARRARLERSRADLVSTVAHELRSPLTSVKGFTATLLAKWHRFTDDQKRVMLETVNADADRVTRLITELLDVSRIESGRMELHRQLVDIPERARKVIAGRVAAGESEDRFRLVVSEHLPDTWLDPDKVDQILGNLVENAVRHGAGTVTIVVEPAIAEGARPGAPDAGTSRRCAARSGTEGRRQQQGSPAVGTIQRPSAVAVSVRDQGEGIAPDLASRVFRQFWRGKRRGGTGLGLYIVKGLVEAHGGTISVGRAPEGGAEFRFTMPAGTPPW